MEMNVAVQGDTVFKHPRPALPPRNGVSSNSVPFRPRYELGHMKDAATVVERTNISALRTHHPPLYTEFPEICDDFGLVQSPSSISSGVSPSTDPSKWKTAFEEARHFAGGLIHHPVESTKHYSILRHSHGLVYYKGPSTSITITIFSDRPLPPDRTLWVQKKGWTGKTGMRAKALMGSNGSWVNVTPSEKADATQLPAADERAWQRDIRKFLDKAPKELRRHQARETNIIRISAGIDDGYFRIILCAGEGSMTVLCPSPVFRVASTSTSSSCIKGASLSTLPMEIGIKVGSSMIITAAGNAISPVASAIQNRIGQHQPSLAVKEAGTAIYDTSGLQSKLQNANQQYDRTRNVSYDPLTGPSNSYDSPNRPNVIGPDSGPESPYPIRISSKVVTGTGRSTGDLGIPTANLGSVPTDILVGLAGVYFGWASLPPTKSNPKPNSPSVLPLSWHLAIITIAPCPYTAPSITPHKICKAHLLDTFPSLIGAPICLLVMGFLRPFSPPTTTTTTSATRLALDDDTSRTLTSLARPAWAADATLERVRTNRSFTDRYVEAREVGRRQLDSVPLHRAGIRGPGAETRERLVEGRGGIYVVRG